MFNLIKCTVGKIPKYFVYENLSSVLYNIKECSHLILNKNITFNNQFTKCFSSVISNKNILHKISKSNFSRKHSKYSTESEEENDLEEQNSNYDLTELSLKEEIKFLQDKNDLTKASLKIQALIDYILNTKNPIDERKISELVSHITNLTNNYRDMGIFEKSILAQEEYKKKLRDYIKDEEAFDYMMVFLNDGIAFDYKMLGNIKKTFLYLTENSQILRERIKGDKLSILKDKESLQANLLNLTESMLLEHEEAEEVHKVLLECLELDKSIREKNPETGFKLYSLLGNLNTQLENLEEALVYFKESLKYKRLLGIEDDEDCSRISKEIAEICIELGDKASALEYYEKCIAIREHLIEYKHSSSFNTELEATEEDEKAHCLEIARIYEAIAEVYHGEANLEVTENLVNKALDYYLKHPCDDISTGRCYMILAELFLEKKEYEKCIEYSKRFIFAWNKFSKEKKKEIAEENFDFSSYSRLEYTEFLNMEYKAYKYIATSYFYIKENFKCRKYSEMAIDKLISLREEKGDSKENSSNENEVETGYLNDFLNYKYELAQLYDLCGNYAMTIKEYNEVINKLESITEDKITIEDESEDKIEKNIILIDAYVGKAEALFKLSKNLDAKKFLIQALQLIETNTLPIEEEKIEEIRKKIELIDLKLKHESNMNFEMINDANDINDVNYVNAPRQSKPIERKVFHVEKISMSDLISKYDKLLTDAHEGIITYDINSTSNNSNNNNHIAQSHFDNNCNSTKNFYEYSNNNNFQARYICHLPDCYKEYKSKYNLRNHIRAHDGGQLYECRYEGCIKNYKIKENLDLHYKNYHLKEKPFKCGFCSKKFSHRNGKLYHEKKKHLNILQFRCLREDCSAAYASRSALKYHLNHQHEKIL